MEAVERLVAEAGMRDYRMPVALVFLPPVLALVSVPLFLLGAWMLSSPIVLAGAILGFWVFYKLISRRNEHFERAAMLYEAVTDLIEPKAPREAKRIKEALRRMKAEEGERKNAVLWVVLSLLVPLVGLYVYHFLNRDFVKHDREERVVLERIGDALRSAGRRGLPVLAESKVGEFPKRSTALYLVLTVITLGIFGLYWLYTLVKDPNEHFSEHAKVEEQLLQELRRIEG